MQNYLAYSMLSNSMGDGGGRLEEERQQQKIRALKSGSFTSNITELRHCDRPNHPTQRMIQRLGQFFDTCTNVLWMGMQHFKLSLKINLVSTSLALKQTDYYHIRFCFCAFQA